MISRQNMVSFYSESKSYAIFCFCARHPIACNSFGAEFLHCAPASSKNSAAYFLRRALDRRSCDGAETWLHAASVNINIDEKGAEMDHRCMMYMGVYIGGEGQQSKTKRDPQQAGLGDELDLTAAGKVTGGSR